MVESGGSQLESATVIGAGVMGSAIAQVLATAGLEVTCVDRDQKQLDEGRSAIEHGRYGLRRGVERSKLTEADAERALERLSFTTDLAAAVRRADIVVEAVPEDYDLKLDVFQQLDRVARPSTILASNTSGLSIA